ncbi:HopJ type III effector protein [Alcanivorax sp. 1008]|uniref:HopJ type III effector protein n=1 Tax=Alcanivorax sp. 1008 TaxID=2816853 RepID=UPI001E4E2F1F
MNSLETLLQRIQQSPATIAFDEVIAAISEHYDYTPTGFHNGLGDDALWNEAGTNAGSCRIFAFAQLHQLDEDSTLACFGSYYRDDVLRFPDGTDHGNIRRFMRDGWKGIRFAGNALKPATSDPAD